MKIKTSYPVIVNDKVVASAEVYEGGFLNISGEDILGAIEQRARKIISGKKSKSQQNLSSDPTGMSSMPSPVPPAPAAEVATQLPGITAEQRKEIQDAIDFMGEDQVIYHLYRLRQEVANNSTGGLMGYTLQDAKNELQVFNAFAQEKGWTDDYVKRVVVAHEATRAKEEAHKQYQSTRAVYNKLKRDRYTINTLGVVTGLLAVTTVYLLFFNKKNKV